MTNLKSFFYKNKEFIVGVVVFIGIVVAVISSGYGLQHLRDIGYLVQYETPVSFSEIILQGLVVVFGGSLAFAIGTILLSIFIQFIHFLVLCLLGQYFPSSHD